jgi:hypothetical protein
MIHPPPFVWPTITGRCWPGIHSWSTREKSSQKGMVYIWEKTVFSGKLGKGTMTLKLEEIMENNR